jgi:hypothetical protein
MVPLPVPKKMLGKRTKRTKECKRQPVIMGDDTASIARALASPKKRCVKSVKSVKSPLM